MTTIYGAKDEHQIAYWFGSYPRAAAFAQQHAKRADNPIEVIEVTLKGRVSAATALALLNDDRSAWASSTAVLSTF